MVKRINIALIAIFISVMTFAQPALTRQAFEAYQNEEFQKAAELVDQSIATEEGKKDAQTWHIRGFVYKDIYKSIDSLNYYSTALFTAIESFKQSILLDTVNEFKDANVQGIKYLATQVYNACVITLNKHEFEASEEFYLQHKDVLKIIAPELDFRNKDIEYYNALASIYDQMYDEDNHSNKQYLSKTLNTYKFVLSLDSNNYGANYNTGILYFNEGVDIINNFNPEMAIDSLLWWTDSTSQLFQIALPFMIKAYELNENRVETTIGLSSIYYSLGEDSLSLAYKLIKEKLENNDALLADEKELYFKELAIDLDTWFTMVLEHVQLNNQAQKDQIKSDLTLIYKKAILDKKEKGDIIRFKDKFNFKQEIKQKIINLLNSMLN